MTTPRCTVITPCYNDGAYLRDLRGSLRVGEPVHHIIVNDGSTDGPTLEVLERLDEESGVTVIHGANRGPASARNRAIAMSKTPYTIPIDADDIALPGAIRDLADALDAARDLDVVWGDSLAFGSQLAYQPRASDLDPWWFTYFNDVMVGLMGRTEVLAAAGWDEGSLYEDWGTTLRLVELGARGRNIGRVTYGYRQHDASRRYGSSAGKTDREIRYLRSQYPDAFGGRATARSKSSAPVSVRMLATVVDGLPVLSDARKHDLTDRLSAQLWRRRWVHHPMDLPQQPLLSRLGRFLSKTLTSKTPTGRVVMSVSDVSPEISDVVIVSPHRDDAVLSAFSLVTDPTVNSHVINVMTAGYDESWALLTGTGDSATEARVRSREDRQALAGYAEPTDLDCTPSSTCSTLRMSIECAISRIASRAEGGILVAAPAGAGLTRPARALEKFGPTARLLGTATSARHKDHVLVRETVVDICHSMGLMAILYDELPYHWAHSGLKNTDPKAVIHLPVDVTQKAKAVRAYQSQLGAIFTAEQRGHLERWLPAVETYASVRSSEKSLAQIGT